MDKIKQEYLRFAKQCIGSDKFKHYFVIKNREKIDVLENGKLSCAFFVTSILKKFNFINRIHMTVLSAVKDMKNFGWKKKAIKDLKRGDVIVWDKNKSRHYHIGFYLGNKRAVSNSTKYRYPKEHHYTYNSKRKIVQVLEF